MHKNHVILLWKDSVVFLQASFTPYLNMDLILVKASTIVHLVTFGGMRSDVTNLLHLTGYRIIDVFVSVPSGALLYTRPSHA